MVDLRKQPMHAIPIHEYILCESIPEADYILMTSEDAVSKRLTIEKIRK